MVSKNARGDQERKWAAALLPRTNKTMIVITNKVRNKQTMMINTNRVNKVIGTIMNMTKKSTKLLPRTNKTMIIITNKVRNKVKGTMMIITNKQ